MNNYIIGIIVFLSLFYTIYLYQKRLYVATTYWIAFFLISFLLPNFFKVSMIKNHIISYEIYIKLNLYYLLLLISFLFANILVKSISHTRKDESFKKINYYVIARLSNIFVFSTFILIFYIGSDFFEKGSFHLVEKMPARFDYILSFVIFGLNLSSLSRLFFVKGKKQFLISVLIIAYSLSFSFIFTFARRLLIYPIIISFIVFIIVKKTKPKLTHVILIMIFLVFIVLPIMVSVRTHGFNKGLQNFIYVISDYETYMRYLAMSTDVSWSYSVAAKIIEENSRINPVTLFKPILMFIPRSVWPNKPLPLSLEIVSLLKLSDDKMLSIPVSIVGEAYVYFGSMGIIIYGLIWGYITAVMDKIIILKRDKYGNDNTFILIITVSLMVQIVSGAMRGDIASTLQETIFVVIPFIIIFELVILSYRFFKRVGK